MVEFLTKSAVSAAWTHTFREMLSHHRVMLSTSRANEPIQPGICAATARPWRTSTLAYPRHAQGRKLPSRGRADLSRLRVPPAAALLLDGATI